MYQANYGGSWSEVTSLDFAVWHHQGGVGGSHLSAEGKAQLIIAAQNNGWIVVQGSDSYGSNVCEQEDPCSDYRTDMQVSCGGADNVNLTTFCQEDCELPCEGYCHDCDFLSQRCINDCAEQGKTHIFTCTSDSPIQPHSVSTTCECKDEVDCTEYQQNCEEECGGTSNIKTINCSNGVVLERCSCYVSVSPVAPGDIPAAANPPSSYSYVTSPATAESLTHNNAVIAQNSEKMRDNSYQQTKNIENQTKIQNDMLPSIDHTLKEIEKRQDEQSKPLKESSVESAVQSLENYGVGILQDSADAAKDSILSELDKSVSTDAISDSYDSVLSILPSYSECVPVVLPAKTPFGNKNVEISCDVFNTIKRILGYFFGISTCLYIASMVYEQVRPYPIGGGK